MSVVEGSRQGSRQRIANLPQQVETWTLDERLLVEEKKRTTRARDLEIRRVYWGLRTASTVGNAEIGHYARDCRTIATVGEGVIGEEDWMWNAQQWDDRRPEPVFGSTIDCLWLCSLGGQAHRTLTCAAEQL